MRLYYIAEAHSPPRHVCSGIGVDAERWNDLLRSVRDWRLELRDRYGIPPARELRPCDLLARGGWHTRPLTPEEGTEVLLGGLRLIEDAARSGGGVEVINVCLRTGGGKGREQVAIDRLLNRINASVTAANDLAFLIFGRGAEESVTQLYRRRRVHNPVPSRYEHWEDGAPTRNIPIERVIGGPAFRAAGKDRLLQLAGFVAYALLRQEGPGTAAASKGLEGAFGILDHALNRQASSRDPQGVVRR